MTIKRKGAYLSLLLCALLLITVIINQDTAMAGTAADESRKEENREENLVQVPGGAIAGIGLILQDSASKESIDAGIRMAAIQENADAAADGEEALQPESSEDAADVTGDGAAVSGNEILETENESETDTQVAVEALAAPVASSLYDGKAVANVETALNIRESASEDAAKVGKLYRGCAGDIVETAEGWVKISSGNVSGWVSSEYILTGADAENFVNGLNLRMATVNADSLNVRSKANTKCDVIAEVENGQTFMVIGEEDGWYQVLFTPDLPAYVHADYVSVSDGSMTAVSSEELAKLNNLAAEKEKERQREAKKKSVGKTSGAATAASTDDATLLAALCQYESAGDYEGMLAVANVVLNRVHSSRYPNSISGVIFAKGQFSGVNGGALDKYLSKGPSSTAVQAANDALAGVNNIGDYTSFCSARIANVDSYSSYTIVGGNCFYKR